MKSIKRGIALIMAILTSFCSYGCNKISTMDFTCFNTGVHIEVTGKKLSNELQINIKDTLYLLEEQFSVKDGSFTKTFNDSLVGQPIQIDTQTAILLKTIKDLYEFTDKKFNPAIYPLVKLWQFSPSYPVENFTLPNQIDVDNLTQDKYLNLDNLVVDQSALTVTKNSDLKVDFGGILKGYATNVVYELLSSEGFNNGYVNIGGSSLTILSSKTLAIRHPQNINQNIIRVNTENLIDFNVSTSGTYERYYTLNDKTYSHIINPTTGNPTDTNLLSATVLGTDGTFGDAVTTALLLCSFDKSNPKNCELVEFINKILAEYPDTHIFVVYDDGIDKLVITNKESETFTLLDDTYSVVKI